MENEINEIIELIETSEILSREEKFQFLQLIATESFDPEGLLVLLEDFLAAEDLFLEQQKKELKNTIALAQREEVEAKLKSAPKKKKLLEEYKTYMNKKIQEFKETLAKISAQYEKEGEAIVHQYQEGSRIDSIRKLLKQKNPQQ